MRAELERRLQIVIAAWPYTERCDSLDSKLSFNFFESSPCCCMAHRPVELYRKRMTKPFIQAHAALCTRLAVEDLGTRLETISPLLQRSWIELSPVVLCSYSGVDNSRNLGDYITEIERDDDEGIPGGSTTILVLSSVREPLSKCFCFQAFEARDRTNQTIISTFFF